MERRIRIWPSTRRDNVDGTVRSGRPPACAEGGVHVDGPLDVILIALQLAAEFPFPNGFCIFMLAPICVPHLAVRSAESRVLGNKLAIEFDCLIELMRHGVGLSLLGSDDGP